MHDQRHITDSFFADFEKLRKSALLGEIEVVNRGACVLCLSPLTKADNKTKEHVFPKWYLRRAHGQKTKTFFASSTFDEVTENSVLGFSHTIPLCNLCNRHMNDDYEKKVSPFFFGPGTPDRDALAVWSLWVLTKCVIALYLYGRGSREAFHEHGLGWLMAMRAITQRGWKLDRSAVSIFVTPTEETASWHSVDILPETSTVSLVCAGTGIVVQADGGLATDFFGALPELLGETTLLPHQLRDIALSAVALVAPTTGAIQMGPGARVGVLLGVREERYSSRSAILDSAAPRLGLALRYSPRQRYSAVLASNSRVLQISPGRREISTLSSLGFPAIQLTSFRKWPISAYSMKTDWPAEAAGHVASAARMLRDFPSRRVPFAASASTELASAVLLGNQKRALGLLGRADLYRARTNTASISNPVGAGWILFEEGCPDWLAESFVAQSYSFTALLPE